MPAPIARRAPEEPRLTRMPHISAPVDEHPLVPTPQRPWLDRVMIGGVLVVAALAGLAWFFSNASALR